MSEQPVPETTTDTDINTTIDFQTLSVEELEKPYRVILENDDVTPMHIVEDILVVVFELARLVAFKKMMEAHVTGHAVVAVLPYAEAHEKVYTAQSIARDLGYPLTLFLEPDD